MSLLDKTFTNIKCKFCLYLWKVLMNIFHSCIERGFIKTLKSKWILSTALRFSTSQLLKEVTTQKLQLFHHNCINIKSRTHPNPQNLFNDLCLRVYSISCRCSWLQSQKHFNGTIFGPSYLFFILFEWFSFILDIHVIKTWWKWDVKGWSQSYDKKKWERMHLQCCI